jgi:hypothetical protein
LYDRAKDRRYGILFLLAPLALVPLLGGFVAEIWRELFHRREQSTYSRLSSDELAKARSKLMRRRIEKLRREK